MTSHDTDGLWDLARGNLSREQAERTRAHVRECQACARLLTEIEGSLSALASYHVPPLAAQAWADVDRAVLQGVEHALAQRTRRAWFTWASLGVGAVVLGALALTFRAGFSERSPEASTTRPSTPAAVQTRAPDVAPAPMPAEPAEVAQMRLGDLPLRALSEGEQVVTEAGQEARIELRKARLWVLADTSLSLAELSPERSHANLAYGVLAVDTDAQGARVFSVAAGEVQASALDAQFLVRREADNTVHLAVSEGSVRLSTPLQQRTVVAGSAVTLMKDTWTLRELTPAEQATTALMGSPTAPKSKGAGEAQKRKSGRTKDGKSLPSVADAGALDAVEVEPAPPRAAPGQPAGTPSQPAPPSQPVPAPVATQGNAPPRAVPVPPAPEPDWRTRGMNALPRVITNNLPESLKPEPAGKLGEEQHLVRKLQRMIHVGDCVRALLHVDDWLRTHPPAQDGDARQTRVREAMQALREQCAGPAAK
jgi:hypothetical protein